jgi:hypothetical protein
VQLLYDQSCENFEPYHRYMVRSFDTKRLVSFGISRMAQGKHVGISREGEPLFTAYLPQVGILRPFPQVFGYFYSHLPRPIITC